MYILIFADLFLEYFRNITKYDKSHQESSLDKLITNADYTLILTKKYIELVEEYFLIHREDDLENICNCFHEIIDNNRYDFIAKNPVTEANLTEEFLYLHNNFKNDFFFTFSLNLIPDFSTIVYNYCVFENISKPNNDWLILELTINKTLSVHSNYFKSDIEIESFFSHILSLKKNLSIINIQDDYLNYKRHNNFNLLLRNPIKVNYFSSEFDPFSKPKIKFTPTQLIVNKKDIQSHFHNTSEYFVTGNKTSTHPRRILFENIIITVNHDFSQIKSTNNNWTIFVTYNPADYSSSMRILSTYANIT